MLEPPLERRGKREYLSDHAGANGTYEEKWSFLKRGYPETIQNRSFSSLLFKYMDAHIFGNPQNAFANKV